MTELFLDINILDVGDPNPFDGEAYTIVDEALEPDTMSFQIWKFPDMD